MIHKLLKIAATFIYLAATILIPLSYLWIFKSGGYKSWYKQNNIFVSYGKLLNKGDEYQANILHFDPKTVILKNNKFDFRNDQNWILVIVAVFTASAEAGSF